MQATTPRTNNFGIDISCIELNLLIESVTIYHKLIIVIIVITVTALTRSCCAAKQQEAP